MTLNDNLPSLMPVVIDQTVWQSAVDYPDDPALMEERLSNLLLSVLLTLRTAGTVRETLTFTLYCLPPQGDMATPIALSLRLIRAQHHVLVSPAPFA
ncbi:hypothetical protein [Dryocola clanedunensis]